MSRMQHERAAAAALRAHGLANTEIAERLGLSKATVAALLRRAPTFAIGACELCGQPFTPASGGQRFCTPAHQREHARLHGPPRTVADARERLRTLEAELAHVRDQLSEAA